MRTILLLAAASFWTGSSTAGCSGNDPSETLVRLTNVDPAVRATAAGELCASPATLTATLSTLPLHERREAIHQVSAIADCYTALAAEFRVDYLLRHDAVARPAEGLQAFLESHQSLVVAALDEPGPVALRAARASIWGWKRLAPESRDAVKTRLPVLVEAGLEASTIALLGDVGVAALLGPEPGRSARAILEAFWKGAPDVKRAELLASALTMHLDCRDRYALGTTHWIRLTLEAPTFFAEVGDFWLRTTEVAVFSEGREVVRKAWPSGRKLDSGVAVPLELGTIAGNAFLAEGEHKVLLAFEAQIVAPGPGKVDDAPAHWSGTVRTEEVSFTVERIRIEDLVTATTATDADPGASLRLSLHARGESVELPLAGGGRPSTLRSAQALPGRS